MGLHLKAFPTDAPSCAQREGQARVARESVVQLHAQGYEVVVLGDLNDYSRDVPDAAGSVPTSDVLDVLRGAATDDAGPQLLNAAQLLARSDRYTAWFDRNRNGRDDGAAAGERTKIDHILITRSLFQRITDVRIAHGSPGQESPSDHWAVIVTLADNGTLPAVPAAARRARCSVVLLPALAAASLSAF